MRDHRKNLLSTEATIGQSSSDLEKGDGLRNNLSRQVSEPGAQPFQPIFAEHEDVTYPEGGLEAWLVVLGSFSGMVIDYFSSLNAHADDI